MIPVLLTKVTLPHRRGELLTRQRLVDLCDDLLDKKLIIVTAPAGYGKTSLLLDVAHQHEFPFCWYALGAMDGDLQTFLTHFVACIEQRFPQFGEQTRAALQAMSEAGDLSQEYFETAIVNEIYASIREHFVIVLDDYHLVMDSQAVNQFISRFIQAVDQNCHLVILSRSLLPLPDLPLMVARSQVGGIGLRELAFRADEIQSLMLQNYSQAIPDTIAAELAQRTEGWITALMLSAQPRWEGMLDQLRTLHVSGVGLYDYLVDQVLDQQPAELRDFLLNTSYLEEFNAELCTALLGAPPAGATWQGMLAEVLRHNLFVLPVEREGLWLRYHHLFCDFLQNRLVQEQPERADKLLRALVEIRARRGEWELAYAACLRLGDIEATIRLLERAGEPMVRSGRSSLLGNWLEALPVSIIEQRPVLLSRQGIVLAMQGDTARGLRMLDRAVAHFIATQNDTRLAGALVWRALVYFIQSNSASSLADASEALSLTETGTQRQEELTRFRAEAYRILGLNHRLLGKLDAAIYHLSQALSIYQAQEDTRGVNQVLLSLGAAYVEGGDFAEAFSCYRRGLEYYAAGGDSFWLSAVLNDLACLHHLKGEFPQAFSAFEDALAKAEQGANARVKAMILIGLGDLFVDLDAPESASEAYTQARTSLEKIRDHFLILYLELAEVAVARLRGEFALAHLLLDAAEQRLGQVQSDYTRALFLLEAGRLTLAQGDIRVASELLAKAADSFEQGGQRVFAGRARLLLASACLQAEETQAAVTHFESAVRLVSGLDSQYILVASARQAGSLLSWPGLPPLLSQQALRLRQQVERFEEALPLLRRSLRLRKMIIPLALPRLRIQALGAAQVMLDEKPLTSSDWQTQVTRDLLYLVISQPQGWSKEALGEVLWPDSSPTQLKNRFKNAIYRLRRALQQDVIVFDGELYSFNWELDYEYDVEVFLKLLEQARGARDKEESKNVYQEIMRLYRGEYLPEIEGTWVLPERERLRQAFLSAGLKLAGLYLDASQNDLAMETCHRLMGEDPCFEDAYYLAMQVYTLTGNQAGAARLYANLAEVLSSELGVAPSAKTQALFHSLVQ